MSARTLHVVRPAPGSREGTLASAGDVGLLLFLIGVHVALLVGFFVGVGWGDAVAGYATAVVLVAGRELAHEIARRLWNRAEGPRS